MYMREDAENNNCRKHDVSGLGRWSYDINTDELVWDDKMYEICEMKKEKKLSMEDILMNKIYLDDIELLKITALTSLSTYGIFDIETRIITTNGSIKRIKVIGEITYNKKWHPSALIGICYCNIVKI